jgi:PIN domain nuclease of toxin-antitoxin system
MIVADSQSIYWYLARPERLSPAALAALEAAEDGDGIVISAWTVPELWMASTRKRGPRAIPRAAYELTRATLLDPDNAIRVEPFDERMWPHFEVISLELADPFDGARIRLGLADKPGTVSAAHAGPHRADVPSDIVRIYPSRAAVPTELWRALFRGAQHQIDVIVIAGLFLPDGHADFPALLQQKGEAGVKVRYTLGDPAIRRSGDPAIRRPGRGAPRRRRTHRRRPRRPHQDHPHPPRRPPRRARSRTPPAQHHLYNSIYRFDGDMLVTTDR